MAKNLLLKTNAESLKFFIEINGELIKQDVSSSTISLMEEDPAIESIFANSIPSQYLEHCFLLAVQRGYHLKHIDSICKNYR